MSEFNSTLPELFTSEDEPIFSTNDELKKPTGEIWSQNNIQSLIHPIFLGKFGLRNAEKRGCYDCFKMIFTDVFYTFFLNQINKRIILLNQPCFQQELGQKTPIIKLVSHSELKTFVAINIYMGIDKKPELKNYWIKCTNTYGSKFVQQNMSYSRYTEINKCLSLSSIKKGFKHEKRDIDDSTKKIINYLNELFNSLYSPNQELSIDEGICKYQGRYSFKTYMPNKPIKVGMKFYILADSKTSFVLNFRLYTRKYLSIKDTVQDLLKNHTGKNHTLYMDNYYNSFDLAKILREKKIFVCGTMRMNRGEPPEFAIMKKKMKRGDISVLQKENINLMLWYDKKVICYISTFMNFENRILFEKKCLEKPLMIKDYDKNMGGVDKYDQMLKSYYNERKNIKWTNKFAIYLMNMMIHNSYIIYKHFNSENDKVKKHLDFRKKIISCLIEDSSEHKIKKESTFKFEHWPRQVFSIKKEIVNCITIVE
ncbi:PiggyBac transposable element-derived protein 4 [Dictyocoela muelleri]|nr:PiggyBac transposable element-derived protein 4 [Dictyocoela muelleri]